MSELRVAEIKHTHWNSNVYEPSDDTFLLVDALQAHAPKWAHGRPRCCLELGCGSGYVITSLALLLRQLGALAAPQPQPDQQPQQQPQEEPTCSQTGDQRQQHQCRQQATSNGQQQQQQLPSCAGNACTHSGSAPVPGSTSSSGSSGRCCQLLAIDHSLAAVEATRKTLQAHQVGDVEVVAASLLGPLLERLRGTVDVMVFNPPYVPTPDEEVAAGGIASAWAGGFKGRRVIDRVLPLLPELLSPRGELFMVTVTENEPKGIIEEMAAFGFQGRIACARQADEETLQIVHLWRSTAAGLADGGNK